MVRLALLLACAAFVATPAMAKTEGKTAHHAVHHRSTAERDGTVEYGGPVERGLASFYATNLIGHRTSSGERLDRSHMTAAHRTLPFGTRLLVTNRHNGRAVVVTVNDRGPHMRGRIIDLSPAAASELGITRAGIADVEVRVASER